MKWLKQQNLIEAYSTYFLFRYILFKPFYYFKTILLHYDAYYIYQYRIHLENSFAKYDDHYYLQFHRETNLNMLHRILLS